MCFLDRNIFVFFTVGSTREPRRPTTDETCPHSPLALPTAHAPRPRVPTRTRTRQERELAGDLAIGAHLCTSGTTPELGSTATHICPAPIKRTQLLCTHASGRAFLCLSVCLSAVSSFVPRHRVRASGPSQLRRMAQGNNSSAGPRTKDAFQQCSSLFGAQTTIIAVLVPAYLAASREALGRSMAC